MDISKLLKPKGVAVVGASDKEGFGGDTCKNIKTYMEKGTYYFINPKREEVFGEKCYPSITSLPKEVELLIICTSKITVEPLLIEGAKKGVKAAVVYASGYGEIGTKEGEEAEESLKALCEKLDIALMGPNCAGFANYVDNVQGFAFISEKRDRSGSIGVVSQSGQLVLSMMDSPSMKFSYAISSGNSKICTMEDYLEFLVTDKDTKVVAMYLEGVNDPQRFINSLKKGAQLKKPIVILKSGRSEKGQMLAASHTGSLSGSDKVFDALFEKFGVIRVEDLEELMATARALSTLKKMPTGKGLSTISLSGGETGICADVASNLGIDFPDFSKKTLEDLKEILPSYATPNNPLDSTATLSYDSQKFAKVLEIVMKDPKVDFVGIGYTLLEEIADNAIFYMNEAIELVSQKEWVKPVVMLPFAENTRNSVYSDKLEKNGVPVLPPPLYGFKVIKNILDFGTYNEKDHDLNVIVPKVQPATNKGALPESQSKEIIKKYNIPCGSFQVAYSKEEAVKIWEEMGCVKVVAKVESPDILHKSDVDCVKLNLGDKTEVETAYDEILQNAKKHCPDAKVDGVLICEMAKMGTEIIMGVNNDPHFGPCILCGIGGVFVEIFKDTALGVAPLSKEEATKMIYSLKGIKMLTGYRGSEPLDINALVDIIIKTSKLACDEKDQMRELDINPVFLYEKGACAVDALYIYK